MSLSALPDLLYHVWSHGSGLAHSCAGSPMDAGLRRGGARLFLRALAGSCKSVLPFIVPVITLSRIASPLSNAVPWTVQLTASAFLLHRIINAHRAFIYPLFVRREKRTPALVCALAFTFCTRQLDIYKVRVNQASL